MDAFENLDTLSGMVEHIIFSNSDNGFTICEIDIGGEICCVRGIMPTLAEGETLTVKGKWTNHPTFGRQFVAESFEKEFPATAAAMEKYLASGIISGIGAVTAHRIVEKFGENTFDVLENHPEYLLDIKGITSKKAKSVSDGFRAQFGIRTVMTFFGQYFSSSLSSKIYKKWGMGAIEIAKRNPYILCEEIDGLSFEKADKFALAIGVAKDDIKRVAAAESFILTHNLYNNGHVFIPEAKLLMTAKGMLRCDDNAAKTGLDLSIENGSVKRVKLGGEYVIYLTYAYEAEEYITEKLISMEDNATSFESGEIERLIESIELKHGISYAKSQKKAILCAAKSNVMILTGGPGTGKTTVVLAMIEIFESLGKKYALCAPTGRAAKRMSEVCNRDAKTVHRLLEVQFSDDTASYFGRNEENLLDEDVIIVDEASMLDVFLTSSLLRATSPKSKIIFIGDVNQLPSVGPGNVLKDLISSERFDTVALNFVFRQAEESLIVRNAHKIISGHKPELNVKTEDFFFIERESAEECATLIADLCKSRLPKKYGYNVYNDIQIITPSHASAAGTVELNALLQSVINPSAHYKKEKHFRENVYRVGDKIMQNKNNYSLKWTKGTVEGEGIFNGDIGIISDIDLQREKVIIDFDGKIAEYDYALLEETELAYAVTVHKSQGSEYPVVIMPIYSYTPKLLTRNLLYTAITRAQKLLIVVGNRQVLENMVANDKRQKRYSALKYYLSDFS